jgi:aminoglycoside 6'-N-acetyltransferase
MPAEIETPLPYAEERIDFRYLQAEDLPTLHGWLNADYVQPWFHDEGTTLDAVTHEYGERLGGQGTVTAFIASYDGEPVGYVQRYFPHLEPDYWSNQPLPPGIAGIDLLIGDERFAHRGFGPAMIRAFLRGVVFTDLAVTGCLIDPDPANRIAIRAYEKVGFRHLRTVGPPDHPEPAYLMLLDRVAFL